MNIYTKVSTQFKSVSNLKRSKSWKIGYVIQTGCNKLAFNLLVQIVT